MRNVAWLHFLLLPLAPLALLASPVLLWNAQRRARRQGLRALGPRTARTVERLAQAVIGTSQPEVPWAQVAHQADRWLGLMPPAARGRLVRLLWCLEWAPFLLRGHAPFSRLSPAQARSLVLGPLAGTSPLWSALGKLRQLARLAYYASPATHARLGFVAPPLRAPARRDPHAAAVQRLAPAEFVWHDATPAQAVLR